jgi:hypothetical protein
VVGGDEAKAEVTMSANPGTFGWEFTCSDAAFNAGSTRVVASTQKMVAAWKAAEVQAKQLEAAQDMAAAKAQGSLSRKVAAAMGDIRGTRALSQSDALFKAFDEKMTKKEKEDEGGVIGSLKDKFGRSSQMGQVIRMMVGGGALYALSHLTMMVDKGAEAWVKYKEDTQGGAEALLEFAKTLPVLGSIFSAMERIGNYAMGTDEILRQAKKQDALTAFQKEQLEDRTKYHRESQDVIDRFRGRGEDRMRDIKEQEEKNLKEVEAKYAPMIAKLRQDADKRVLTPPPSSMPNLRSLHEWFMGEPSEGIEMPTDFSARMIADRMLSAANLARKKVRDQIHSDAIKEASIVQSEQNVELQKKQSQDNERALRLQDEGIKADIEAVNREARQKQLAIEANANKLGIPKSLTNWELIDVERERQDAMAKIHKEAGRKLDDIDSETGEMGLRLARRYGEAELQQINENYRKRIESAKNLAERMRLMGQREVALILHEQKKADDSRNLQDQTNVINLRRQLQNNAADRLALIQANNDALLKAGSGDPWVRQKILGEEKLLLFDKQLKEKTNRTLSGIRSETQQIEQRLAGQDLAATLEGIRESYDRQIEAEQNGQAKLELAQQAQWAAKAAIAEKYNKAPTFTDAKSAYMGLLSQTMRGFNDKGGGIGTQTVKNPEEQAALKEITGLLDKLVKAGPPVARAGK